MATPMYNLIGTDKSHQEQQPQIRPEPTKTRPKKSGGKNPNPKKQPQRGLGVAQLERLRLQERWRKMTEMPPPPPLPPQHFQCHSPFLLDPSNFPVQFAGAGQALVGDDCGGVGGGSVMAGFDCHQGLVAGQRIGNGGFINYGGGSGLMTVEAYQHGGVAVDPRVLIENSVEASRELSSIPKFPPPPPPPPPPCISDRCDICSKKKRILNFNNNKKNPTIAFAGAETASFDFLGLSTNSAAEFIPVDAIASTHHTDSGFSFDFNPQGGAEIKRIHRKAAEKGGGGGGGGRSSSSSSGSSVLMEYEFFPGKNGRGAEFEEQEMPKEEELLFRNGEQEGSCITTSCTDHIINGGMISSSSAATHLDLSLKLSF